MTIEVISVTRGDGFVDVVTRHRTWDSIPEHERVTEADMRARYAHGYADWVMERELPRLEVICIVATAQPHYGGKYLPCGKPVHDDDLCPTHGGKKRDALRSRERLSELQSERDALRERVAELEASA